MLPSGLSVSLGTMCNYLHIIPQPIALKRDTFAQLFLASAQILSGIIYYILYFQSIFSQRPTLARSLLYMLHNLAVSPE